MEKIEYHPIGIMHSPFKTPTGTPIQPIGAKGIAAEIEVFAEYIEGLADLAGFSHIIVLYHFHLAKSYQPKVKPFLHDEYHGLFATRAPARPNSIGLSVVRLDGIAAGRLQVRDLDVVDQTPLLDIKPYVPEFDVRKAGRIGWFGDKSREAHQAKDDGRFEK